MNNKNKFLLIIFIVLFFIINLIGCYPMYDTGLETDISEEPTGFVGVFAKYGTWIWCSILLTIFLIPAIVISLVVYLVSKKSIDKKVLEEKKSRGFNPKSKPAAVILSIFFSFWSWLYTYKINFKKFWVTFSIIFGGLIIIIILIVQGGATLFVRYGTWIWFFWLLCSGPIWLWALLDNSFKSASFFINYPKGFDQVDDKMQKPIVQEKETDKDKYIYCMRCGARLPANAVYCKKCGKKVE
jgi:ribosomal protein L40E